MAARFDVGASILGAAGASLANDRTMVEALASGDPELCVAHVLVFCTLMSEAHNAFVRAVAGACAQMLLARGSVDDRLIAVGVVRATVENINTVAEVEEDPDAWAEGLRLPRDPVSIHEALVRLSLRRREGPHAQVFEKYTAELGEAVRHTPDLFDESAACARRLLDRGDTSGDVFTSYVLHALVNDRDEEARARFDVLTAASKPDAQASYRALWSWSRVLAEELRARERAEEAILPWGEEGFVHTSLGEFTVVSGTLVVTDPSYERTKSPIQAVLHRALRGPWKARLLSLEIDDDTVPAMLLASHAEHPCPPDEAIWSEVSDLLGVGVDSAQAGIFDLQHYRDEAIAPATAADESAWYAMVCAAQRQRAGGGVVPYGCVARSGFGDGLYPCWTVNFEGRVVGVAVSFDVVSDDP
jgi:hypothetical protein